jgi:hypothetical protein
MTRPSAPSSCPALCRTPRPSFHIIGSKGVDGRDIFANARKTRFALLPGHDEREAAE